MASDVDICNLALLRLGTRSSIASLSEGSTEANACAMAYPIIRDDVLCQHPWGFATRRNALAELGKAPLPWWHRYAYPTDCLKARTILRAPGDRMLVRFEVSGDQDESGNPMRVILTNRGGAVLIYTAAITTAALFDAPFIEALAWMMAAELAIALTGDKGIAQACAQTGAAALANAKARDANESPEIHEHLPDWVAARGALDRDGWAVGCDLAMGRPT